MAEEEVEAVGVEDMITMDNLTAEGLQKNIELRYNHELIYVSIFPMSILSHQII